MRKTLKNAGFAACCAGFIAALSACSNINLMDLIHAGMDPIAWSAKVAGPNTANSRSFGETLGLSGDNIVVGDPGYSNGEFNITGCAYIYRFNQGTVELVKELEPSAVSFIDGYAGSAVAISGDFAAVSYQNDPAVEWVFDVFISYNPQAGGWESNSFEAPSVASPEFARSLAVTEDFVAAGSPAGAPLTGEVVYFKHSLAAFDVWDETAAPLQWGTASDNFGACMSASGGLLVIGAPGTAVASTSAGAAVIAQAGPSGITTSSTLAASDGADDDYFGSAVGISGDYIIVGAPGDDDLGAESGSAYIFENDGAAWTQAVKLTAAGGTESDSFGYSVAISGDLAAVGAYQADVEGVRSGCVYLYRRTGVSWVFLKKMVPDDPAAGLGYGRSLAISDRYIVVGAPGAKVEGALYVNGALYAYGLK